MTANILIGYKYDFKWEQSPVANKMINDMKKIEFRTLTPDDIEVRPAQIKDSKATLLCYIDSRSVVELMDEAVGPYNWNFELVQVGDQVVGKMGIWDEDKRTWVVKSDVGSESNIEASKGLVSSIYKRCISRWGLQDLYTVPRIVVDDDGYGCKWKVGEISWNDNRECTHITLVNKFGKVMYTWSKDATVKEAPKDGEVNQQVNQVKQDDEKLDNLEMLRCFCKSKIEEEPEWKDDIIRFGKFYAEKASTWNGVFKVDSLYSSWASKRRAA